MARAPYGSLPEKIISGSRVRRHGTSGGRISEGSARLKRYRGIALTYSMGDGISRITPIGRVEGRGIRSREGAGKHIGGGTRVFDQIRESDLPAVLIPGLHRDSPTDTRFRVYSHQASPEKIGIAYRVSDDLGRDFIVSDVSSNTVTLLVKDGLITGGLMPAYLRRDLNTGRSMWMRSGGWMQR